MTRHSSIRPTTRRSSSTPSTRSSPPISRRSPTSSRPNSTANSRPSTASSRPSTASRRTRSRASTASSPVSTASPASTPQQYGQQPGQYGQQPGQYGQQPGQYGQFGAPAAEEGSKRSLAVIGGVIGLLAAIIVAVVLVMGFWKPGFFVTTKLDIDAAQTGVQRILTDEANGYGAKNVSGRQVQRR